MNSKRRQLPLEVSSWMERDLTLRKITANSRLLTNDTRQNIVLSRQFFSNLLTLSVTRYRKIAEHDFNKRVFIRNQRNKTESPLLGSRQDQSSSNLGRMTPNQMQSSGKSGTSLTCPSAQSFLSRTEIKSDPLFNRTPQPIVRQTRTAQPLKADPDVMPPINPTTSTLQRPTTRKKISFERINRLAQPKNLRPRTSASPEHVRTNLKEDVPTPEDIFGKIDNTSEIVTILEKPPVEKPRSAADDTRFRRLEGVFSKIYSVEKSNSRSVRSIVQSNPSLQDSQGQWKSAHSSAISRKAELERDRQVLADKLNSRLDVFLIDVGA